MDSEPRRIRLAPIGRFLRVQPSLPSSPRTSAPGARVITDGWRGYGGLPDHDHAPKIVGTTPAHLVLRWSHRRVLRNLKRWALGTFHGLRRPHLITATSTQFVFRWNRRRHTATAFDALLGIGTRLQPAGYRDIVEQRASSSPSRPTPGPHSRTPVGAPIGRLPACLTAPGRLARRRRPRTEP